MAWIASRGGKATREGLTFPQNAAQQFPVILRAYTFHVLRNTFVNPPRGVLARPSVNERVGELVVERGLDSLYAA